MGIKELGRALTGGSNRGEHCVRNEDGSITCRRIKMEGNEAVTDGTEINFGVDPQTCKPILTGEQRIMDGDSEWARGRINREVESCKKGLA